MPPDENRTQSRRPKVTPSAADPASSAKALAFVVEPGTGRIMKVEAVNASGERHELSDAERAQLEGKSAFGSLERVIEQAFEAGIDCVLGEGRDQGEPQEDAELSQILLRSLLERSGAGRLMRRDVLNAAIVGTLVEQAASFRAAAPKSTAAH